MTQTPRTDAGVGVPALDPHQAAAVEEIVHGTGHAVVVGEPGSGKTTVVVAAARAAVEAGLDPAELMVLVPTRDGASRLRDRVAAAIDRPAGGPLVRTPASLAYAILSSQEAAAGRPRPVLISGPEQDLILRELIEGHLTGRVAPLDWAGVVPDEATRLQGFRGELRDLLMRAAEWGLVPEELEDLAERVGRPEWAAAASLMREYLNVTTLRSGPADQGARFDPASITSWAAHTLRTDFDGRTWRLVIVDDAQDATAAVHDMLRALAERGTRIVLVGNADEAVQGYRGALPAALDAATRADGEYGLGARLITLGRQHRQAPELERITLTLAERIGKAGVGAPRRPVPEAEPRPEGAAPAVTVLTAPHRYGQSRAIAAQLRRARHGLDGEEIPWHRMCVIARSTAQLRELRSDLSAADIPCAHVGEAVALHSEPAVAPLLRILRAAVGEPWTEEDALFVLGSRLIGLDPVALRRLRRELVREERAGGGERTSTELLLEAIESPERWATVRGPEARAAAAASRAVEAARERMSQPAPTPGAVLWSAWEALGVADAWREAALAGSARDDADLDAVIALLKQAQTYAERLPGAHVIEFISYLEAQDFAADSLGARGRAGDVVSFATAASALGREWDVVVVAGLEEGVWPNLTLRDSVLGAAHLADLAAGRAPAVPLTAQGRVEHAVQSRRQVLDDETRAMLVAVSRARRRLIATAHVGEDARESRFLTLIADTAGVPIEEAGRAAPADRVADLRSAVVALRVIAERAASHAASSAQAEQIARVLAWLAREGVPGADPDDWHGVPEISTTAPLWEEDERVRVSPSKVEWIERCALRWALEATGGTREATEQQQLGTLIHEIAAAFPHGGKEQILAEFEAAWRRDHPLDTWAERVAFQRGTAIAERLADYLDGRADREVVTERSFMVEVGRADLVGSADRIEVLSEGAYVVDLKTGTPISVGEAESNAQLAMYQLAIAEGALPGHDTPAGAELAYLSSGNGGTSRRQAPIDVEAARERLAHVVDVMTQPDFVALVNDKCGSCPARRSCPAQAQGRQVTDG